jgi:recombination protein RecA
MANLERSEHKDGKGDTSKSDGKVARDPVRDRAIELAVATIEKQFGKGSIMRLGEDAAPPEVRVVPTGALGLDIALGTGGLPRGRIVEIYGPESSGKTTLALHVAAQAQRAGGIAAFVDAEHALDVGYARKLGVNHGHAGPVGRG